MSEVNGKRKNATESLKYAMETTTKTIGSVNLHRIRATRSIPKWNVKKGDIGGWIETEKNLSQDGDAWVFGDAWVSGKARVFGDAQVSGNARVSGDAWVFGNARVSGDAQVFGDAWVSGEAQVFGDAWVSGDAQVFGDAWVSGNAQVSGNACVSGYAWVSEPWSYIEVTPGVEIWGPKRLQGGKAKAGGVE